MGVSSFEDKRIYPVPFAVDDAVDLAHLFTLELGLLLPQSIVLLLAGEPRKPESIERLTKLIGQGARRQSARMPDVYRHLGEIARSTEDPGLFVLAVATHGVSDQGGDFLIATDSLKERMLRTGVAVAELLDEVSRAGAKRRLVLLDTCRERLSQGTRGDAEAAMAQSFAKAIASAQGSVVLSASTLGGFAYDDPERRNGVFTAAVLDGLHGQAKATSDGWITVETLAEFVQQRVAVWVRRNRPDHAMKSPGISFHVEATAKDLPLARHPEAVRDRRRYHRRREAALERVKKNQGRILPWPFLDQIAALLPEQEQSPEAERLLEEIEALDGRERAQRSLRDYLRELSDGINQGSPIENLEDKNAKTKTDDTWTILRVEPNLAPRAWQAETREKGGKNRNHSAVSPNNQAVTTATSKEPVPDLKTRDERHSDSVFPQVKTRTPDNAARVILTLATLAQLAAIVWISSHWWPSPNAGNPQSLVLGSTTHISNELKPTAKPASAPQSPERPPTFMTPKTHTLPQRTQESTKPSPAKQLESSSTLLRTSPNPETDSATSGEQSNQPAGADMIIGLWKNPGTDQDLIEIRKDAATEEYITVQASNGSSTSYRGEIIEKFRFDSAQNKYVGKHLIGGGKSTITRWGADGALVIELDNPNSFKKHYLDSLYKGGWTFSRVANLK